ncbi:FecR domain-containing protein [bacterium]|nr:FecR domain-containing protein [bacterium]MBT6831689.1 FecR domain-containing protein [bacterium]MBT6996669.1 FecR domain-containing protein [bacterium]MBT7772838.1 FecR domain-containing protein [bacterium]
MMRHRSPRRKYAKHRFHSRQRPRNYRPLVSFFIVVLVIWGGVKFFQAIFSEGRSETSAAVLQIQKGVAEFSLDETETWTRAYSEQQFLEGDSLRTSPNSRISLEIFGGNTIFLGGDTELFFEKLNQRSEKKTVVLRLDRGNIWATVSEDDFASNQKSKFVVETAHSRLQVTGTVFDLQVGETEDTIRLVKGGANVEILDETGDTLDSIEMGVGQKLVANPATAKTIKSGQDPLTILDSEFVESEWHLQNLENFAPQEAAQIRRKIEISAVQTGAGLEVNTEIEAPKILSPNPDTNFPGHTESMTIEGTAPDEAFQIVVNGYTLTKFRPGDRKWSYFASRKFGTLIPGENVYSAVAVTREGKQSPATSVRVFYEGTQIPPKATAPAEPAPNLTDEINNFSNPVVLEPAIPADGEAFETTESVVKISGLVDPKTNAVEVNGFRLQKFRVGNTKFQYTANAQYGNMKSGENLYAIKAFGPDGKTAQTEIRVIYTPQ